eukprot:TRINITY_DN12290_c0_g1_i1.p3 TRINITY_DN12290_c0_g1~~TRINITY_DN12290_c0_g1_i1.p3  ORF type:complete len:105 (+),score=5.97 TRINITY_DN12290_c0_g1_i1:526-840(+)
MGYVSTACIVLQWSPQIWVTFKNKSPGSLSLPMLLIQAPASFLVIYYQAVIHQTPFSTWAPFLIRGLQQFILIALIIIFMIMDCNKKRITHQELQEPLLEPTLN